MKINYLATLVTSPGYYFATPSKELLKFNHLLTIFIFGSSVREIQMYVKSIDTLFSAYIHTYVTMNLVHHGKLNIIM
jgi:hypothetical protein